ncbi:CheY-like chemotaxis protein [Azorhizobium sp. AG788]|uniref:response regulator n=1 Tax=Azorhizobium sp. AG788 TaxID=2183897 RepID=UPI0010EC5F4A|nr:response regulator [Azorhizobium sp. AG788]TDT99555.1 CheY-like chemotaxis protein [Azorhizobium sp. AG788]
MSVSGKRILVVEDEFLVALGLQDNLRVLGYETVGPATTLAMAVQAAEREPLDAAILDINLKGEVVFPAAEILSDRGIPLIFCSDYIGVSRVPDRFADAVRVPKPYTIASMAAALREIFDGDDDEGPDRHSDNDQSMSF